MTEELPEGWAWAKIGDVCEVNPRHFDEPPEEDDLLSVVPMASVEVETGRLEASRTKAYGEVKRKSLTPFQENDVIFSKITPCMENGKIALAEGLHGGRAVGSTEFLVLRCGYNLNPKYLMYFLLQSSFRKEAELNMTGAVGQRRVPKVFVSGHDIPVPPLDEQHRIVSALELELSRMDNPKSLLENFPSRRRRLAVRFSDSRIEPLYNGAVKPLDELLREPLRNGHSARSSSEGGVRTLMLTAVTKGVFSDEYTKLTSADPGKVNDLWIRSGDILVQRSNTPDLVGTSAMYEGRDGWAIFPDLLVRVRCSNSMDPEFVLKVLQSSRVRSHFKESAKGLAGSMPKIDQRAIGRVMIPAPSLEDQRRLVVEINDFEDRIGRVGSFLDSVYVKAQILRRSLLTAAFTGTLVPQDPADEPATALLERVRAEQAAAPKPKRGRKAKTSQGPKNPPIPEESRPVPAGEQTVLEF